MHFVHYVKNQVVVGASIGIAITPSDGGQPDILMKNADLALYRAKADGGGAYRFFELAMDARMQARSALELDLRKAIVNGEFELFYQPIVDVRTNHQLRGSHPLVSSRTRHGCAARVHSDRGRNRPHLTVGRMGVAAGLCRSSALAKARDHCGEPLPAQFKSRNLVPTVINALATSGRSAGRLELEITELVLL